ncbi:hypothetical protein QE152_g37059 [Popillia japonica]|uniref:Uncharacterized protein n=1 Tax=Popillia japonica TaxID=7064 RepID=A0AAW1IBL5_POPJA
MDIWVPFSSGNQIPYSLPCSTGSDSELPIDIFQTAKVSKILLMMEKGCIPAEYKGKSLAEIHFDNNLEYAEENNNFSDGDDIILNEEQVSNATPQNEGPNQQEIIQKVQTDEEDDHENLSSKHTQHSQKPGKRRWSNTEITLLEKRENYNI